MKALKIKDIYMHMLKEKAEEQGNNVQNYLSELIIADYFHKEEPDMSIEKRELTIGMKPEEWRAYYTVCNKAVCKKYKDPSAVFQLGLKSIFNQHC